MPPKKINVGKCLEEQKGCKTGFQDMFINNGEKLKRETSTPRPRAGKLLSYGTSNRIAQQNKKESPKKQFYKSREESSLTSPKTTRSPPKGLLFQTASATTVLQGLKDTPAALTKRDLQNSSFSQDPNVDGTKTQRILQWLHDCEVAQNHESSQPVLLSTPSNPTLVEQEQSAGKWKRNSNSIPNSGSENCKSGKGKAGQLSKIPQKGTPVVDKKYLVGRKSVEKRKRSNAELGIGSYTFDSEMQQSTNRSVNRSVTSRRVDLLETVSQVKKVKNWNPSVNPVVNSGNTKRQQKVFNLI